MRHGKMLLRALGVEGAVAEGVRWSDEGRLELYVDVRVRKGSRCPHCGRRCGGYDQGAGRRRWRAPDVGLIRVFLEASTTRIRCPEHGVVVQAVPWARPRSKFTRAFEDIVAWFAVRTDETTLTRRLGVAWPTVGRILERVTTELEREREPLANVTRIGIDEVSYRKRHRYLTIVVDHDTGRLLFASPGKGEATLERFFEELGEEATARLELVSLDAAAAFNNVVRRRCPNAIVCLDPFHVVQWATKALDAVRRNLWKQLQKSGQKERAKRLKGSRWSGRTPADFLHRSEPRWPTSSRTTNRSSALTCSRKSCEASSKTTTRISQSSRYETGSLGLLARS